ncbi:hypothetical protein [Rossellomorea sp. NS-SX7]|uniref:hypothetical protein n=1 Tax=Rossellomorea sp. NS-SX7 TaxID=3463856 RepID=UPI00405939DE
MLKGLRMVLAIIVVTMAGYGLLTDQHWLLPYLLFLMGLNLLVMALEEFQRGKVVYGYLGVGGSLFLMVVLFFL